MLNKLAKLIKLIKELLSVDPVLLHMEKAKRYANRHPVMQDGKLIKTALGLSHGIIMPAAACEPVVDIRLARKMLREHGREADASLAFYG